MHLAVAGLSSLEFLSVFIIFIIFCCSQAHFEADLLAYVDFSLLAL